MSVYPVPLVGETSFAGVCIAICPCCCPSDRAVVLRLEDVCEYGCGLWREERFSHEAYLVVYYMMLVSLHKIVSEPYHPCSMPQLR